MAEKKAKNDRSLRFYNEVLGLERLHYGLWNPEDEFSITGVKKAQKRYEQHLIDQIPAGSKSILDVGCGTGIMSRNLIDMGYDVEGLSPDINQKEIFTQQNRTRFHFCRFEDFEPDNQYDCVIMSESAQYIPVNMLFRVAGKAIKENKYLLVCDYFLSNSASGPLAKSGHNLDRFMAEAGKRGFKIIYDEDITDKVVRTLDLGKNIADRILLAINIGTEKIRQKYAFLTRFILWMFRKKINSVQEDMRLLDSEEFKKNKIYKLMLFQLNAVDNRG